MNTRKPLRLHPQSALTLCSPPPIESINFPAELTNLIWSLDRPTFLSFGLITKSFYKILCRWWDLVRYSSQRYLYSKQTVVQMCAYFGYSDLLKWILPGTPHSTVDPLIGFCARVGGQLDKLDPLLMTNIEPSPHHYLKTYFTHPTWCTTCKDFLWGVHKKAGYKCATCSGAFHGKSSCRPKIPCYGPVFINWLPFEEQPYYPSANQPQPVKDLYVKVLFDYKGEDSSELDLHRGEFLRLEDYFNPVWFFGSSQRTGKSGFFLKYHVTTPNESSFESSSIFKKADVMNEVFGQVGTEELSLKIGQKVILGDLFGQWYRGTREEDGIEGYFPRNCIGNVTTHYSWESNLMKRHPPTSA